MKRGLRLIIVLMLCTTMVWAQSRTITGIVKSADDGEALIGVSIKVKDGMGGTLTDMDGKFEITVPEDKNTITINYIGFIEQEIKIGEQTNYNIKLASDNRGLDEVVVVGYGTVKRKDLTGSVSSISAKELKDIPLNSSAEALTGRLAGVNITSSEGQPGADVTVRVRGGGSITQDNAPIYIVDGVQMENALQVLTPQEIESVDVLKDAASTAIYGARGANGVIVITTKGGKDMPTRVSFDMFYGVRKTTNKIKVLNPSEYVKYQYQIYNYGTDEATRNTFRDRYGRYEDLDIYNNIAEVDWQDEIFGRSAKTFTQNINVMGGAKGTSFSLTLSNTNEQGVMINSGFKRTMASFKFDHKISNRVKVGFNARYGDQRIEGAGTTNTGTQSSSRLRNAVRYKPFLSETESIDVFDPDFANLTNLTSPLLLAQQEIRYAYRRDILLNGYANINILKNLQFRTVIGVTPSFLKTNQFSGEITPVARQNADMPVAILSRSEGLAITNSNTLSYNTKIKKHSIDALLGQEIYSTSMSFSNSTTKWLPVGITADEAFNGIQRANPPAGMVQDAPTTGKNPDNRLLSFFGRVNYSYDDKYLATFTYRRDGSSLFAEENRWGNFPSLALAWRLSNEKFWEESVDKKKNMDIKVRASIGTVGNNRIAGDLYRTMFGTNTAGYAFAEAITPGLGPVSLSNPNLKWETTISRNLGLDVSLFNNRVSVTLDYYVNTTKDLLLDALVPSTSGYTTQIQNLGSTQNKGWELQLNTTPISNKNFLWNSNFNIAANRNKVTDLGTNPDGTPRTSIKYSSGWITSSTMDFLVQVGQPLGQFYGYVNDGYYTLNDFTYDESTGNYTLKDGVPNNRTALGNRDPQPGDMKFKKLNTADTSDLINETDMTVIGNALPKFTGGWNNQFSYKNFDLSIFVYFSIGNKVYNANKIEYTGQYNYRDNNVLDIMENRWKWYDDNGLLVTDPAQLAAMNANTEYWTPSRGQYTPQSFAIEDGSFLRISNITLGYTFPDKWLKKTRIISKFRIYGTVNNLYTFTNYSGFDPEANTRRNTPLTPGVDFAAYPRSRFFLAGLNITF
ncbi:MAG: TonB-dependent receptor [Taibaiella sp.]|jgi:TonB-linked SusC/RagA family outer membrane protein